MLAELHCKAMNARTIFTCNIWLVQSLSLWFCIKLLFPYNKGINFIYYSQVVPIFEKVPPTQIPIKQVSSLNPIHLIKEWWAIISNSMRTRLTMISLCTLQRLRTFPHNIYSNSRYIVFLKHWLPTLGRPVTYFPTTSAGPPLQELIQLTQLS